ncbi:MAG: hypothetical protein JOZ77_03070 [Candidatus Eremiobacteraeota bacterium]|nr:hypothetical protein [Candidatus Eremiobacteraeota bacterium]
MTLRKVPGALALGLLAALAAHTALFGGEHAMGGTYHAFLLQAALVAGLGLVVFFGALAWTESANATEGTVLAARLRERLPGLASTFAAALLWYLAAEMLEPHHAGAPPIAALLILAIAAWLTLRLAGATAIVLGGAAIAILRLSFAPRTPSWQRRATARPIARRRPLTRRRFARPPPVAI